MREARWRPVVRERLLAAVPAGGRGDGRLPAFLNDAGFEDDPAWWDPPWWRRPFKRLRAELGDAD